MLPAYIRTLLLNRLRLTCRVFVKSIECTKLELKNSDRKDNSLYGSIWSTGALVSKYYIPRSKPKYSQLPPKINGFLNRTVVDVSLT